MGACELAREVKWHMSPTASYGLLGWFQHLLRVLAILVALFSWIQFIVDGERSKSELRYARSEHTHAIRHFRQHCSWLWRLRCLCIPLSDPLVAQGVNSGAVGADRRADRHSHPPCVEGVPRRRHCRGAPPVSYLLCSACVLRDPHVRPLLRAFTRCLSSQT